MNWASFIKKLLTLDVIFGARSKKLTGIPDSEKVLKTICSCDGNFIYINNIPKWITKGQKLKISGSINNEVIVSVVDVSNSIKISPSILPFTNDMIILDGRMASFYTNDIARNSEQGSMFNVNKKGSGISSSLTNHFHRIEDIYNPEYDSPEVLGKILISEEDHSIIVDNKGNTIYSYPDNTI